MDWVAVNVVYMLTRLIDSSPVLHLLMCPLCVCVCVCVCACVCDLQNMTCMQTVHYHLDRWHVMVNSAQGPENTHTRLHAPVTCHEYLSDVLISCRLAKLCWYDILLLRQYKLQHTHRNTRLGKQYYHCQHNFRSAWKVSHNFGADCAGKLWNSGEWI